MELINTENGLKAVVELDEVEINWWRKEIGKIRKRLIPSPKESVSEFFENNFDHIGRKVDVENISELIQEIREGVWGSFVNREIDFFRETVNLLVHDRDAPKEVLDSLLHDQIGKEIIAATSYDQLVQPLLKFYSESTGRLFPYFYELSKSQTNSRRSRAGAEFEEIIDQIMRRLEIPYDSQAQLGQKTFSDEGLGKKVDGVVPSMESYNKSRSRCIIATMKTSIRERWQEVVEELNRTNIPSIHLLTLDDTITANTLELMNNHNMTLVTYKFVKDRHPTFNNIMDFETFFGTEIPHTLEWWRQNII